MLLLPPPTHVPELMTEMSASSAALASQKRGLREVAIRRPMVGDRPRILVQCKVGSPRTLGWGKPHAEDSERIAVQSSNNRPAPNPATSLSERRARARVETAPSRGRRIFHQPAHTNGMRAVRKPPRLPGAPAGTLAPIGPCLQETNVNGECYYEAQRRARGPNGQSKGRLIAVDAVPRRPERRLMRYRVHCSSGCVPLSTAAAHSVSFEFLPTDASLTNSTPARGLRGQIEQRSARQAGRGFGVRLRENLEGWRAWTR